jgi:hypothetical protein
MIFIAKATTETVLLVTIFPLQLNKCLRVSCRLDRETYMLPHPDNMVVLGLQLL